MEVAIREPATKFIGKEVPMRQGQIKTFRELEVISRDLIGEILREVKEKAAVRKWIAEEVEGMTNVAVEVAEWMEEIRTNPLCLTIEENALDLEDRHANLLCEVKRRKMEKREGKKTSKENEEGQRKIDKMMEEMRRGRYC